MSDLRKLAEFEAQKKREAYARLGVVIKPDARGRGWKVVRGIVCLSRHKTRAAAEEWIADEAAKPAPTPQDAGESK